MDEQNVPINKKFTAPVTPPPLPRQSTSDGGPPVPPKPLVAPVAPKPVIPPPPSQPNRPELPVPIPPTPPSFMRTAPVASPSPAAPPTPPPHLPVAPAVAPSPVAPVAVAEKPISIRTMKDDVVAIQRGEFKKAAVPTTLASVKPLAARQKGAPAPKTITSPTPRRSFFSLSKILTVLSVLVVIAIIGGVGWYFWQGGSKTLPFISSLSKPTDALTVLPSNSLFIWHYHLTTTEARQAVVNQWAASDKKASLTSLLTGDPRLLASEGTVTDFYYVALPNDPRLYVVVTQNEATKKLFEGSYDVTALKKNGWYILHGLGTDQYETALNSSSLQATSTASALVSDAAKPVQMWFSAAGTNEVRKSASSGILAAGGLDSMLLEGQPNSDGSLDVAGSSSAPVAGDPNAHLSTADLLPSVPGDATSAVLGTNLNADITTWLKAAKFDSAALDKPAVAAFMSTLTGPYALYTRLGQDATPDAGLVIPLPQALQDAVRGGDTTLGPAIEQALPELVTLLGQNQPATAVSFSDGAYQQIALRYANVLGQTVSLDYALTPTTLFIATSKEGMQTLLDTAVTKQAPNLSVNWQPLPAAHSLLVGALSHPLLSSLVPSHTGAAPATLYLVLTPGQTGTTVTGHIALPSSPAQP